MIKTRLWFICLLAAMIEGFDIQSMGVVAPSMVPALQLTPGQAGLAFSASLIGLMCGASVGGWIADRVGRRSVLTASVALFGLFSLLTALANGFAPLLAVRFLTGLGLGGAMPMLIALASEQAGPTRKATMVALVVSGMPLGGAVAGLVAGVPMVMEDWRIIFVIGGVAPLLLTPFIRFALPPGRRARVNNLGVKAVNALFGPEKRMITACLWLSFALAALTLHLLLNWLPTLLVSNGMPPSSASGVAVLFNIGAAAGGISFGLLVDRMGPRWPLVCGFGGLAVSLFALGMATTGGAIAALACAAGFLLAGGQFTLYGMAPLYYTNAVRGVGVGAAIAASRVGSIFGPVTAAQLISSGASGTTVVVALVPIVITAGAASFLLSLFPRGSTPDGET